MCKGMRILVLVSIVLALLVSLAGTVFAQAPALALTPTTVPATQSVIAKVTGFKPKEAVVVLLVGALGGEDIILTGGEADDKGNFTSPEKRIPQVAEMATIPEGVKAGQYQVKATGTSGSTATAQLTVTAAPTPTPKPAATPTAAAAAKPAATPAPAAAPAAGAAVPKTGAPLPISLFAMAGAGLGVLGFALRRKF